MVVFCDVTIDLLAFHFAGTFGSNFMVNRISKRVSNFSNFFAYLAREFHFFYLSRTLSAILLFSLGKREHAACKNLMRGSHSLNTKKTFA